MDHNELKNLMRKYLGDLVDSKEFEHLFFEHLFVDDLEKEYKLYPYPKCKGITHLHKCVSLVHKYPAMNDYLEEYLKVCNNINQVNDIGDTALHLLCYTQHPSQCMETTRMLVNAGIDVNIQNEYGNTALYYVIWNCTFGMYNYNYKTIINILINAGANIYLPCIGGKRPIDYLTPEQQDYFKGRNTKCAIKK